MGDTTMDTWPPYITAQRGAELLKKKTATDACAGTLLEKNVLEYKSALKQTSGCVGVCVGGCVQIQTPTLKNVRVTALRPDTNSRWDALLRSRCISRCCIANRSSPLLQAGWLQAVSEEEAT